MNHRSRIAAWFWYYSWGIKTFKDPPRNKCYSHSLNTDLTTHNPSFNITLTKTEFRSFPTSSPFHLLQYNHNKLHNFCHDLSHITHKNLYWSTIFFFFILLISHNSPHDILCDLYVL